MTEKMLFDVLYKKHGKMLINLTEACRDKDFGMSYSKASKMFGGKDAIPESVIKEKKLLPIWETNNCGRRMWKITEIVKWLIETEDRVE